MSEEGINVHMKAPLAEVLTLNTAISVHDE